MVRRKQVPDGVRFAHGAHPVPQFTLSPLDNVTSFGKTATMARLLPSPAGTIAIAVSSVSHRLLRFRFFSPPVSSPAAPIAGSFLGGPQRWRFVGGGGSATSSAASSVGIGADGGGCSSVTCASAAWWNPAGSELNVCAAAAYRSTSDCV